MEKKPDIEDVFQGLREKVRKLEEEIEEGEALEVLEAAVGDVESLGDKLEGSAS